MPLEQIRPSVRIYGRAESTTDGGEEHDSYLHLNEAGEEHVSRNEGDLAAKLAGQKPESMNLLKLGGVGGVTRSGSWNRDQSSGRHPYSFSSLTLSPEEEQGGERPGSEDDAEAGKSSKVLRRAHTIANHEQANPGKNAAAGNMMQGSGNKSVLDHVRSNSSDVTSSSRSTSSSSYSAAAFSLRSVSNRNSVSSTASSAASSHRSHLALSEADLRAKGSTDQADPPIPANDNDRYFTNSLMPDGDALGSPSTSLDDRHYFHSPKSTSIGPSVSRIRSIGRQGRFNETDDAQREDTFRATTHPVLSLSGGSPRHSSPTSSTTVDGDTQRVSRKAQQRSSETLSLGFSLSTVPSPSPTTSDCTFVLPAPRRHTGAHSLRTHSSLSQTSSTPLGSFFPGGGGRAAARERGKGPVNSDNAPFSELEARHRALQNNAALSKSQDLLHDRDDAFNISRTQAPTRHDEGDHESSIEPSTSSLPNVPTATLPVSISMSLQSSGNSTADARSSRRTSLGLERTTLYPLNVDAAAKHLENGAHRTSSGVNADAPARPGLLHASTFSIISPQVLRTPTTEEWTRFIAKQSSSIDSDLGPRLRSNTARSAGFTARLQHDADCVTQLASNDALADCSCPVSDLARAAVANAQEREVYLEGQTNGDGTIRLSDPDEGDDSDDDILTDSISAMEIDEDDSKALPEGRRRTIRKMKSIRHHLGNIADSDEDEEHGFDSPDECMQALHEAISRPVSRRASPTPHDMMTAHRGTAIKLAATVDYLPNREAVACQMGYPLPPTGESRRIEDFVIMGDIGRGAYGLVKRAKLRDQRTGVAVGEEVCIKYIIKSRILADCWRRHKVLGPIPIEIHVMDQLRRLTYRLPLDPPAWSQEALSGREGHSSKSASAGETVIGHPSLCKMLDFFEDREFYYMVMPCFGTGQDLFDYVESHSDGLSCRQVRSIFGQIADGLRFLHSNNIVHRDVKDENVILDNTGNIQIIDFGSAAHVPKSDRLFDTFSGTLDYAAAEILRGERYSGKEQDVWALGVVGYVLLCGDCPFWNGEEAILGLVPDARPFRVLQDRASLSQETVHEEDAEQREVLAQRGLEDRFGQADGGGKIVDAVDLIQQCLALDQAKRPTMEQICHHRFLVGHAGWHGDWGWKGEAPR